MLDFIFTSIRSIIWKENILYLKFFFNFFYLKTVFSVCIEVVTGCDYMWCNANSPGKNKCEAQYSQPNISWGRCNSWYVLRFYFFFYEFADYCIKMILWKVPLFSLWNNVLWINCEFNLLLVLCDISLFEATENVTVHCSYFVGHVKMFLFNCQEILQAVSLQSSVLYHHLKVNLC